MANHRQTHAPGNRPERENDDFDAGQAQINSTGTDELLDEIDSLLENNAEEFVNSFVQKGGQ
ncbi:ubiquitin-like protein Pup [Corynebacterium sp. Marseille-P4321]|uniref:ubiquitin-like protein Pup n=1 Tax=Corynebacterium sp. Marseille-P4321 TaxID=2736603 RepID=UPI000892A6FD|nr:ubiquitin-like protein Pup [Corynebacterium sp. Marseille-P4321]OEY05044.1 ubiquitin-like protein Pup [Corynebacterium sp. BCW_4722]